IVFVAMGTICYRARYFGRLYFQTKVNAGNDTLEYLHPVAEWIQENKNINQLRHDCRIMTDDMTYFYLSTFLGLTIPGSRVVPIRYLYQLAGSDRPSLY